MALATKPKKSNHHKKRNAGHHAHNKHYLKHYWPYLPMIMVIAIGIFVNSLWSSLPGVLGASTNYSNTALLAATNANRTANNRNGLTLNSELTSAAQAKAEDMVNRNYWAHISPDGKTPWAFINESGYKYRIAGENLAYGFDSSDQTIAGWMNSPSHRENMLNASYKEVGFGIAHSQNYQGKGPETIVVAEYGDPLNESVAPARTANMQISNNNNGTSNLEDLAVPVSRVAVLASGKAQWSTLAISAAAGALLMYMVLRFGLKLRKLALEGESFVLNHPVLDISIIALAVIGIILTRTSGFIN